MKSRTSFFNTTVLRKDITRYAPVWGLYTIGLVLFLLVVNLGSSSNYMADAFGNSTSMAGVNLILAGITALMVFGDLFKVRLCYATHALPLRREGWFLTHFTAGLLFSFVPNLFICLCALPLLGQHWYMVMLWLLSNTLQYLFFFGAAAFCAVCAGNRLGASAAYLILNFGMLLIGWYAEDIYMPLLYGMEFQWEFLDLLMPASMISGMDLVDYTLSPFRFGGIVTEDWIYLGIAAAVGLLLAFFAILIYRKRHMETAGDFLSLPAAKPVFLVIYTLAVGYWIGQLISIDYIGLVIGLSIGFFTGKMLLTRTVKVFKGWNFLQFGILVTALTLSIGLTALDPVGITRYVPDTEDVETLHFSSTSDNQLTLSAQTDAAQIEQFRQLHEQLCNRRYSTETENTVRIYLEYELKNGCTVYRKYDVPTNSEQGEFVRTELSRWQTVFSTGDWDTLISGMDRIELEVQRSEQIDHYTLTSPSQIKGLMEALKADCDAGNMAQNWNYHQDDETAAWLYIFRNQHRNSNEILGDSYWTYSASFNIYESCEHALAYIDSLGLENDP